MWDHVAVSHSGHGDQRPPQPERNRAEVISGINLDPLRIVNQAGEYDDAEHKKEHQQHQLLGWSPEGLQQNFKSRWMSGQLEQSQDSDDAEELEDVGILDVRDVLLEKEVRIEADGSDIINHIHWRLQEITLIRTGEKPERKGNVKVEYTKK